MNCRFLFLSVLIALSTIQCQKYNYTPDYSGGRATALRNGEHWEGVGRGYDNVFGIGVDMSYKVYNQAGERRQSIVFIKIPLEIGTYPLYYKTGQEPDSLVGCSFYTLRADGDVIEDALVVLEDERFSNLTVESYDAETRQLKGEFEVKLYVDPAIRPKSNPQLADTLHFTNGRFEVYIEE